MNKKLLPLIGIAFVVALISTAAFYSLFAARMTAAPAAESKSSLVIARRALEPGTVLKQDDLSSVPWSGPETPVGAFASLEQVAGQTLADGVPKGELILASRLVSRNGANTGIPEGMRAVSIHVSDSAGVVEMLRPGHKVDVQVFGARSSEERQRGVRTLLRAVPVLAVSKQLEPSSQGYFTAPVVTVLVSSAEAEPLAFADSFLRLRIALRNPAEPVSEQTSATGSRPAAAPSASTSKFVIRTFGLTEEGFTTFADRLSSGVASETLSVAVPGDIDIPNLLRENAAVLESERTVVAAVGRLSYFTLTRAGHEGERIRVGIAALEAGRLKVRPELSHTQGGRQETRALETEVRLEQRRSVVLSGFGKGRGSDPRHVIVVISSPDRV
jgi:Flp pilus assembly protein CpaB